MNYFVLWTELDTDPLGRGYSGMSDASAASNLNTADRDRNRTTMEAYEVFNAIKKSEFNALSSACQTMVWNILNNGTVNPFGLEADLFVDIFGAGASTITTLADLRKEQISRGTEIGLGRIQVGDVTKARLNFGG